MNVKFDTTTIQHIKLFENLTSAKVKDCLVTQDKIIFVVPGGELGKAIGRQSYNLKNLKLLLKKDVAILEHSENLAQFIKNIFYRYKVKDVKIEEGRAIITVDPLDKGKAIGKGSRNLKIARELVRRHYQIKSLVVR
ncbi:MAG: NusA-like transcription termination signal-binding factor [Candidatus Thermoplasmatota archaeon]|nr:NusA-like transcription termination signal-binding factor [Candidatus Thermoplasmatota archaeon]